jgi:hypothetical protein
MAIYRQVYAILRYDEFQDSSIAIENRVTVTRVTFEEATARAEVQRLNSLNAQKGCKYFMQATRLLEGSAEA